MRRFRFAKLVRDKIVQEIIDAGNTPKWRTLTNEEYVEELKKKLLEEMHEVSRADNQEIISELADVQEIIDSLLQTLHVTKKDLQAAQTKKNKKAGAFRNKQYIESVETNDASEWVNYYKAHPDKYPEIK